MSEEFKNSENLGEEQPQRKPFSVNISDEDFAADDIPAPEGDVPSGGKPHKVVRYVDNAPKEEAGSAKKKGGFMGEFIAGAAAGAKSVGEGISAGIKTVSEKKPKEEKPAKAPKPVKEEPVDETQFPKDEKKSAGGFMNKLNSLPVGAVIGGAAVLLIILVAVILLGATSCAPNDDTPSDVSSSGSGITINSEGSSDNTSSEPEPGETVLEVPTRKEQFVEAFNANNDVMGWLYIPGLEDIDAGVCFSYDKSYPYDKRDITGKKVPNTYWIDGAYYTHFRNICGETADELSKNTVIFGHSDLGITNLSYANDDPTGPLFSQLFNFKDPSFAEKTPYIYLTLPGEDTVWEIFSVFYNDANAVSKTFSSYYKKNGGSLWYIEPSPVTAEFQLMLDTAQERSLYDYDVEVTTDDRILTLSTCTVGYGLSARSNYRFVIVAKLVENPETEHIEKNASFTINAEAPIPSTYKEEFQDYVENWKPTEE
ncbi:MAG: class B sortase [Oscillospiraceae bacterium]|nr:class B sortase [Oscillospiraceae bacterium]